MAAANDRARAMSRHSAGRAGAGVGTTVLALVAVVMLSALGVVASSHNCRELYADLQAVEAEQWHLQEEFGRLLLERSTWSALDRVERLADAELDMHQPALRDLRLVQP